MFFQDPQAEKPKPDELNAKPTFRSTVTAKAPEDKPALSPLAQIQKELISTVASLNDEKMNGGSLNIRDWKGSTKEIDNLKLWIPQAKDIENLKLLAKYLNYFLEPNNHKLIAAKVSSNEDARTKIDEAHKAVSNYLREKIKSARETETLRLNDYDAKIDKLIAGMRSTFRNYVE